MKVHPEMVVSLMNDSELVMAHLFTHNSYSYAKPYFKVEDLITFHHNLVHEMERRKKSHPKVDFLDKVYK